MIKKFICLSLVAMLFSQGAQAIVNISSNYDNGIYTISGSGAEKSVPVKIEILKDKVTVNDFQSVTAEEFTQLFEYVYQGYSDSSGRFEFSVPVSGENENHIVKISSSSGVLSSDLFYTYTDEKLNTAVLQYMQDSEKTPEKLSALIDLYYAGMDIDYNDFYACDASVRECVLEYAMTKLNSGADAVQLGKTVNEAVAFNEVVNTTEGTQRDGIICKKSDRLHFDKSVWIAEYKAFSSEERTQLCNQIGNTFTDAAQIGMALGEKTIILDLKKSLWNEIGEKLQNYCGFLKIDCDLKKLSSAKLKYVETGVKADLENGIVTDASTLETAVKKYISTYSEPAPSGGGGGGGGVRTTGNSYAYTPVEPEPKQELAPFSDMTNYGWASSAVKTLYEDGVINGKGNGLFAPAESVSREEFVAMAMRALHKEPSDDIQPFSDVSNDRWSYDLIMQAKSMGIINGMNDNTFCPTDKIKRCDIAVIAAKILNSNIGVESQKYDDEALVPEYARESVSELRNAGIMNGRGDNVFAPLEVCTRVEAAQLIYNLIKAVAHEQ